MEVRPRYYLWNRDTDEIRAIADPKEWSEWFQQNAIRRIVAVTDFPWPDAWIPAGVARDDDVHRIKISTVFLGLDHSFTRKGPPVLFETMIFGLPEDHELYELMDRYETSPQARKAHDQYVLMIRAIIELAEQGVKV